MEQDNGLASLLDMPVVDDLNVPVLASEYTDQQAPAPVKPGNYRIVPLKVIAKKTKDGKTVLVDEKFPVLSVQQIKVVEGLGDGIEKTAGVFSDVSTKPFKRKRGDGSEAFASQFNDFMRFFDAGQDIESFQHGMQLLQEYLATGRAGYVQIKWEGYDGAHVKAEFANLGIEAGPSAKAYAAQSDENKNRINAIYNTARKGSKDFLVNGEYVTSIIGPSGETIEAQPRIGSWYPSDVEIGKGKDAKGRAKITLGEFTPKK